MTIECVLFDLDGTFADTAPDLHFALNQVLAKHGRQPISYQQIRPAVSHGSQAMLKVGFGIEPDDPRFSQLQKDFLAIYLNNIAVQTKPFDGIPALIERLEQRAIRWGIVTNKPAWLTDPLMRELDMHQRASAIVSGDTTPYTKPHPEPVRHACQLAGVDPARSLYVGDAIRDIQAGRHAGTKTLIALFGYLSDDDEPSKWEADGQVSHPLEILHWL
ncbi:MAG: HAD-IA family hydrolase [Candidatus Thiodiazotropha sp. (ex Epidulcina cf. delphinae)]|nr:HAD-IA family hydrolase [Candidatus Thiodiazotropha sp. (ex Epidulcina cf. delphinae)]